MSMVHETTDGLAECSNLNQPIRANLFRGVFYLVEFMGQLDDIILRKALHEIPERWSQVIQQMTHSFTLNPDGGVVLPASFPSDRIALEGEIRG